MKKMWVLSFWVATAFLVAASSWEGSAVVAGTGEMPESGYYIATNSFPKNTIVDVLNLETEKTVRAIVSSGLDSPGLLAALSAEAAAAVGMDRRSVGRIRITMPADPIAFSRFTEVPTSSADPDRDPAAAVQARNTVASESGATSTESNAEEPIIEAPETPEAIVAATVETTEGTIVIPEDYVPPPSLILDDPLEEIAAEEQNSIPETLTKASDPSVSANDINLTEPTISVASQPDATAAPSAPPETVAATEAVIEPIPAEPVAEPEPTISVASQPDATAAPSAPPETVAATEAVIEPVPAEPVVEPADSTALDVAEVSPTLPETPSETSPDALDLAEPAETQIAATPEEQPPASQPSDAALVIEMVPAEARPPELPESTMVLEPLAEPVEIAQSSSVPDVPVPDAAVPDAIQQPEPVAPELAAPEPPELASALPSKLPLDETFYLEPNPRAIAEPRSIEAPIIAELERGQYYLQLGAFASEDSVNEALKRLGAKFPTAVQAAGDPEKPVYRIVVGPVTHGESGALLMRFKRGGYPDAFLRKGL